MNKKIHLALAMILTFAVLCTVAGCSNNGSSESAPVPGKDRVLFVGGGTIDDNAASTLLFTMEEIEYLGIVITNSDCIDSYAMQVQWKLQSCISKTGYPISLSDVRGYNSFPWSYRGDCIDVYNSLTLQGYEDNSQWPPYPSGEALLEEVLTDAIETNQPVTLLITEPITPLCNMLQEKPHLEKGIKRVIWMGGAIDVPGNLDPETIPAEIANNRAEWNAFWDPGAVDWVFRNTSFPIIMFPLDVTDEAKLTQGFMSSLQDQSTKYRYSKLVYSFYSLVSGEPYFEMWNTLTTAYVARPDLFEAPVPMYLSIETEGYWQGAISRDENGRLVNVVLNTSDIDAFYSYVLGQLKRD